MKVLPLISTALDPSLTLTHTSVKGARGASAPVYGRASKMTPCTSVGLSPTALRMIGALMGASEPVSPIRVTSSIRPAPPRPKTELMALMRVLAAPEMEVKDRPESRRTCSA